MSLVPVDTSSEVAVTDYLTRARDWLSRAVDETGPEQIAAAKAEIATAAEATKQLGLSKEIQDDAVEMVRRAEYALGKAIRKGQEAGEIETLADARSRAGRISTGRHPDTNGVSKRPVSDFASRDDLLGNGAGIAHLSDGIDPAEFDVALEEAKAEGNLSRANVVRKVRAKTEPPSQSRQDRADLIADLAAQGYSSRQMPIKVGVTEESVRQIARDFDIEIPADRSVGRTRRINSTQVVENTATALEGLVSGVELIKYPDVDPAVASQWADSLDDSLKKLRSFANQIRKAAQ